MRKFKFIYTVYYRGLWDCKCYDTIISAETYEDAKAKLEKMVDGKEFSITQGEEIR